MSYKVFVDGGVGTTGLKIRERLTARDDIEIINIREDVRKDLNARLAKIAEADITFLCLPDEAAREIAAAAPVEAKILDTSTAHRVDPEWVYGMPELKAARPAKEMLSQRERIRQATRVAVPGCHASGFIFLVAPLIAEGLLPPNTPLAATSVTGYSGGGKKMIAAYEDEPGDNFGKQSPGQYGLSQHHKHLPEMQVMTGLQIAPTFLPIVGDFYSGMVVTVPLPADRLETTGPEDLAALYSRYYEGETLVSVYEIDEAGSVVLRKAGPVGAEEVDGDGFLYSDALAGRNDIQLFVYGNPDRPVVSARFDNLGKGASGAAIQNMNLMLGVEETKGLL